MKQYTLEELIKFINEEISLWEETFGIFQVDVRKELVEKYKAVAEELRRLKDLEK